MRRAISMQDVHEQGGFNMFPCIGVKLSKWSVEIVLDPSDLAFTWLWGVFWVCLLIAAIARATCKKEKQVRTAIRRILWHTLSPLILSQSYSEKWEMQR